MKTICTYGGDFVKRNWTVADLLANRGHKKLSQVSASNIEAAGIDMLSVLNSHLTIVRKGAPTTFTTAALPLTKYSSEIEVMRAAFGAMEQGADAIYTLTTLDIVTKLANAGIPVMGHLGLIPRKSTWLGGLRAVGKTATEAWNIYQQLQQLENAGAFAVKIEVVPQELLNFLNERTSLLTISTGAGSSGDVMFLLTDDIVGENEHSPRHARAYRSFYKIRQQLREERIAALKEFDRDVKGGAFPNEQESLLMPVTEWEKFLEKVE